MNICREIPSAGSSTWVLASLAAILIAAGLLAALSARRKGAMLAAVAAVALCVGTVSVGDSSASAADADCVTPSTSASTTTSVAGSALPTVTSTTVAGPTTTTADSTTTATTTTAPVTTTTAPTTTTGPVVTTTSAPIVTTTTAPVVTTTTAPVVTTTTTIALPLNDATVVNSPNDMTCIVTGTGSDWVREFEVSEVSGNITAGLDIVFLVDIIDSSGVTVQVVAPGFSVVITPTNNLYQFTLLADLTGPQTIRFVISGPSSDCSGPCSQIAQLVGAITLGTGGDSFDPNNYVSDEIAC